MSSGGYSRGNLRENGKIRVQVAEFAYCSSNVLVISAGDLIEGLSNLQAPPT